MRLLSLFLACLSHLTHVNVQHTLLHANELWPISVLGSSSGSSPWCWAWEDVFGALSRQLSNIMSICIACIQLKHLWCQGETQRQDFERQTLSNVSVMGQVELENKYFTGYMSGTTSVTLHMHRFYRTSTTWREGKTFFRQSSNFLCLWHQWGLIISLSGEPN